ncbi:MAG: hypothetical protein KBA46_00930 [Candidatus Omnitrophica bacterium]|nr:hypothetical protein [Candidatus Omnitrophota bacterium]
MIKKILLVGLCSLIGIGLLFVGLAFAGAKRIEFKFIAAKNELDPSQYEIIFDVVGASPVYVYLDKRTVFDGSDIRRVVFVRHLFKQPEIVFHFEKQGFKKFRRNERYFLTRDLCLLVEGKIYLIAKARSAVGNNNTGILAFSCPDGCAKQDDRLIKALEYLQIPFSYAAADDGIFKAEPRGVGNPLRE